MESLQNIKKFFSAHGIIIFLTLPRGMQDLSSPARDRNCAPCNGSITTRKPGKSLVNGVLKNEAKCLDAVNTTLTLTWSS